jgi:integrase
VSSALEALYARQQDEKAAGGAAYPADMDGNYIAADELGRSLHPEHYSDEFARLCGEADVPAVRLHDTRASMNGLLEKLGVADSLRAAWFGHSIAVNRTAYLGAPRPEDLAVITTALGEIFRSA